MPEAYLRGFTETDTGFLNIHSKRSNMWRRQKPKQVMVRNKYYHQDWVPEGIDKNILEKTIGNGLEPEGLKALAKLIKIPNKMSDDDIAKVLTYVQFQRLRVPRQADIAMSLARSVLTHEMSKSDTGRYALKNFKVSINDSFRFNFLEMVHSSLSPYFSRMVWEVIKAEEGLSFVTSDSPVSFWNEDFIPPMEPGPGLYGTNVFFPINKYYLLHMYYLEYETGEKESSDPLPKNIEVEDGVIEIRSGGVFNKGQIESHNRIMYQLSQDLIAGESKNILEAAVSSRLEDG